MFIVLVAGVPDHVPERMRCAEREQLRNFGRTTD